MAELEAHLAPGTRPSPFSQYVNDLSPTEAEVVQDYFARIRTAMLSHLRECEIPLDVHPTSLRWALQCGMSFIGIAVHELGPENLRGYGVLDEAARARSVKIREDLERLVDRVAAYARQGLGRDLSRRLSRLEAAAAGAATLGLLERVVTRWQLVEFRPALEMILGRLEAPSFEIAVFGQVSSGKSSLLNHIADSDALPVGVTPVTAVPTRLLAGEKPAAVVSFAESGSWAVALEQLWQYASEEGNPGNRKRVTGIAVKLPARRLRDGVVFVDTPGVGALAFSSGAEALAYLPRCDLGLVLIDAASALNEEDLALLRALYGAGIPVMVLLSKADLLTPGDRERMIRYIRGQFRRELGLDLPVHPVSIVGADEALLTEWFDRELTPLLDRHRSLTEASLRRKIAHVRESVIAVLGTLLAKRRGGGPEGPAQLDTTTAQRLLEGADEVIRRARQRALDWSSNRQVFVDGLPGLVADAVVAGRRAPGEGVLAGVVEAALIRRGRVAHGLVTGLQEALAGTSRRSGRRPRWRTPRPHRSATSAPTAYPSSTSIGCAPALPRPGPGGPVSCRRSPSGPPSGPSGGDWGRSSMRWWHLPTGSWRRG